MREVGVSMIRLSLLPVTVLLILVSFAPAWGQSVPAHDSALTLGAVLASIARHHPQLTAAEQDVVAATADLRASQGAFDPKVSAKATEIPFGPYPYTQVNTVVEQPTPFWGSSFFAGWRYGRGDIPSYYNYETNRWGELRAGVSVPLWRNNPVDKRRADLRKARFDLDAADFSAEQTRLETAQVAAEKYWSWVAAGRKRAIAEQLLRIAQERATQVTRRVRGGDLPALEQTDNSRVLVQREGSLIGSVRALRGAALALSLYLRDGDGNPVVPSDSQLPPTFPELHAPDHLAAEATPDRVLGRRPDIQKMQAKRQSLRVQQGYAANQQRPKIDVLVATSKDLGRGRDKLAKPELELGLTVEIPTLNRAASGNAQAAMASVAKLDAELQLKREKALVETRDAFMALEAAHERVALARKELELAHAMEEGERSRFFVGDSSLLVVNLREQAAAEAAVREVEALAEYFKAEAALRAAIALPYNVSG